MEFGYRRMASIIKASKTGGVITASKNTGQNKAFKEDDDAAATPVGVDACTNEAAAEDEEEVPKNAMPSIQRNGVNPNKGRPTTSGRQYSCKQEFTSSL